MADEIVLWKIRLRSLTFMCLLLLMAACSRSTLSKVPTALEKTPVPTSASTSALLNHARDLALTQSESNSVALLENGNDALLSRIHLIRSATESISIQTLIWANDESGRLFMYELIQAARRGVKVRFLIDQLSSESQIKLTEFLAYAHPNFSIKLFNPVSGVFNQPKAKSLFLEKLYALVFKFHRFNHRMHNKTFIVDNLVAITGGRNYQNAYYDRAFGMNYKDRDILAVGHVVDEMTDSFDVYWASRYSVALSDLGDARAQLHQGQLSDLSTREGFLLNGLFEQVNRDLQQPTLVSERFVETLRQVEDAFFVADSPRKRDRILLWFGGKSKITHRLASIVANAKESIYIQTPYLVLTSPAQSLFKKVRSKYPDIDIRISTNSLAATDSWHVYALSYKQKQAYLQELKFKIYEFMPLPGDMASFMPELERLSDRRPASGGPPLITDRVSDAETGRASPYLCLHGKSMVVDEKISFVGSYNLDPRSENMNTEAGLFIRDREFARLLREHIEKDMSPQNSWVVARKKRPLGLDLPNTLLVWLSDIIPLVDIWPFRYATSFQLIEGRQPVDSDHPDFYKNYRDVGSFPEVSRGNVGKEFGARGTKAFLSVVKPLL
jgi:cardiolipin synthase C